LELLCQMFDGIKYIHSVKVIHRDLKPQNIFINVAANDKYQVKKGNIYLN
jgi:serine/threonine protein kinase